MTAFLASVRNLEEADIALRGGADILDLKEPVRGALGAVDIKTIAQVAAFVAGRRLVSATTGDVITDISQFENQVRELTGTGVDIIKFPVYADLSPRLLAAIDDLNSRGHRLVAVLMSDVSIATKQVTAISASGLFGVMLDTADKQLGTIVQRHGIRALARFVEQARAERIGVGIAGGLSPEDVANVLLIQPDFIGFRGALCVGGRTGSVNLQAVEKLRSLIPEQKLSVNLNGVHKHELEARA